MERLPLRTNGDVSRWKSTCDSSRCQPVFFGVSKLGSMWWVPGFGVEIRSKGGAIVFTRPPEQYETDAQFFQIPPYVVANTPDFALVLIPVLIAKNNGGFLQGSQMIRLDLSTTKTHFGDACHKTQRGHDEERRWSRDGRFCVCRGVRHVTRSLLTSSGPPTFSTTEVLEFDETEIVFFESVDWIGEDGTVGLTAKTRPRDMPRTTELRRVRYCWHVPPRKPQFEAIESGGIDDDVFFQRLKFHRATWSDKGSYSGGFKSVATLSNLCGWTIGHGFEFRLGLPREDLILHRRMRSFVVLNESVACLSIILYNFPKGLTSTFEYVEIPLFQEGRDLRGRCVSSLVENATDLETTLASFPDEETASLGRLFRRWRDGFRALKSDQQ